MTRRVKGKSVGTLAGDAAEAGVAAEGAADAVGEQITAVRDDLEQMRALLSDAIEGLISSFTRIALLSSDAEAAARSGAHQGSHRRAEELVEETRRAMVCLQFQDLIDQLLTQILRRMDRVEHLLGHDDPVAAAQDDKHRVRSSRVTQRAVDPGDVELF